MSRNRKPAGVPGETLVETELRRRIAAAAGSLIGVRWAERGRDVKTGIDCLGHVLEAVCRATGIQMPDPLVEGWACWRIWVRPLRPDEMVAAGDLVLARALPPYDKIDHVGILAMDRRTLWHAARGVGVIRTALTLSRVAGYRRFRPEAFAAA